MRCLVGIDDTDSSRGSCTTYLAYRIAIDLNPEVKVLPYPRLVRLNPNVPFKTRGNASVSFAVETSDADRAFGLISEKVAAMADVDGGANSGLVFLDDPAQAPTFEPLYHDALKGIVSPHRVRRLLKVAGARTFELGNGMGIVGATSALAFDERSDHTYELISYRRKASWGTKRVLDASSVKEMDRKTFPHTFNNYDHQKRKVLIAPHGPDPVFAGVRGDSPATATGAFGSLEYEEPLEGYMVYVSNQHTDAHLQRELEWKAYSSGWMAGTVEQVEVGTGGHVYIEVGTESGRRLAAAYEPTGDLRRAVRLLQKGDRAKFFGGVRRPSTLHPKVLNLEKVEVVESSGPLIPGFYISSPRANRHLTKPLVRYGREVMGAQEESEGWLASGPRPLRALARSR
jgi:tRNA(Ile2)-agmatinylcytidine synthase